jgi:hypothetical protein
MSPKDAPLRAADNQKAPFARSSLLIALGQVSLLVALGICFRFSPHAYQSRTGISSYGVHWPTIVPYTIGFALASATAISAAYYLPSHGQGQRIMRLVLYLLGGLYMAVLLSTFPYQIGQPYNYLHVAAGSLLYGVKLALAFWFTFAVHKNTLAGTLFGILLAGVVLTFVSYIRVTDYLLLGQMITGLAFSIILVRATQLVGSKNLSRNG